MVCERQEDDPWIGESVAESERAECDSKVFHYIAEFFSRHSWKRIPRYFIV